MMPSRVTIKSIARDLGISHMTVSRALSNHPKVRDSTRKAVLDRARELGYVRSSAATAMRGDQTRIIGLLLPNLVNEFYARYANSLARHCEEKGLQLIIHLTNDDIVKEEYAVLKLREVQASALVMVPAPGTSPPGDLYLKDLQVIQLIRTRELQSTATTVLINDSSAIIEAVKLLCERGHKRIAYIGGETALSSGHDRLKAFKIGMQSAGLEVFNDLIHTDRPSFSMGYQAVTALWQEKGMTAIVCGGFEISNGALNGILERDIQLPKEVSFVGYGDPSYYRWLSGGITTIKIPTISLAEKTSELLFTSETDGCQVLNAELIIRNSVDVPS